jgi:hypothetical protein
VKKPINQADAHRLAMAQEMIWWYESGAIGTIPNKPSGKAYAWVDEHYEVTDEIPPKFKEGES